MDPEVAGSSPVGRPFMTPIESIILGLVQGFTEFLPVSSSGHLVLTQKLLGFKNLGNLLFFDIVCHLGTLCSIFVLFWKQIKETLKNRALFTEIIIATLPLFPLVLLIKPIKVMFDRVDLLGFFFLITAFILWLGVKKGYNKPLTNRPLIKDSLAIGLYQALALLPGVSRSGSTISGARLRGWPMEQAISFSFILGIVAILGSSVLEGYSFYKSTEPSAVGPLSLIIGFFVSFVSGIAALKILIRVATKKNLLPFAYYCLILGIVTLILFNYG